MPDTFTIGTAKKGSGHEGVLRAGKRVVVRCGHRHTNRDHSTGRNGRSAWSCIEMIVKATRFPATLDTERGRIRANVERTIRLHQMTTRMAEEMRVSGQKRIAHLESTVEAVAQLIGDGPVFEYGHGVVLTPKPPTGPCGRCGKPVEPTNWYRNAAGSKWGKWRIVLPVNNYELQPYGWDLCINGSRFHCAPVTAEV